MLRISSTSSSENLLMSVNMAKEDEVMVGDVTEDIFN